MADKDADKVEIPQTKEDLVKFFRTKSPQAMAKILELWYVDHPEDKPRMLYKGVNLD